ncbi:hypothetical protein CPAR01_06317 [Colletotrichum paranaense]|uniref:Uncharacterized protein n=1 Tax=Colletotrichum paranaense TaxID=1914294 RepID=A0ABQ9SLC3_9PEZI|nr:uncharacterized protein CPAR01_06317 [Colletotrichum paranaense]KAK1540328.1 hypothetical protein CPAR01_06317 [Colletotrichum paranaense]
MIRTEKLASTHALQGALLLSKSPDPGYFTCLSSCPCTAGFSTNCCQDPPFCALEPTCNGRPQLPPVPAILAVATTMDNADPGASILGITVPPAACRREPPSNLQGQASYEPVKAYSKRHTVCSP